MSTIKDLLGEDNYGQFRDLIAASFPGSGHPDDHTVDGFVSAFYRAHGDDAKSAGLPSLPHELVAEPPLPAEDQARRSQASYPTYIAQAVHHRVRSMTNQSLGRRSNAPFQSEFIGHLPVVRVPVPAVLPPMLEESITTSIGQINFRQDHLVGSVQLITEHFGKALGYTPARADLITPARTGFQNRRFGAIAIYLGYKNRDDKEPSFYIFEAGMATGEAKTLYLGPDIGGEIVRRSGYVPTAYSSANNDYKGRVIMRGDELYEAYVQPIPPHSTYYAQISVRYEPLRGDIQSPFDLLVEAAKRIALIGQNMGVPSGVPLQSIMAGWAKSLEWIHQPAYGGPGTLGSGDPLT